MIPPPCASSSGMPPVFEATTGSPDAMASKRAMGKGSFQMEGQQNMSASLSKPANSLAASIADELCIAGPRPFEAFDIPRRPAVAKRGSSDNGAGCGYALALQNAHGRQSTHVPLCGVRGVR